ncbi:MAG: hypothetical protein ACYDHN_09370 [Solirubrobacteraceae bacterium]
MSIQMTAPSRAAIGVALALCTPSLAQADATSATIVPTLTPDRLGSRSSLTYTIHFTDGKAGVPSPVHRAVLQFPAGLTLELPTLHSCSPMRLRAHGPTSCPPRSELGSGHALAEFQAGSQVLTERLTMWVFLGPPRNLQPTVEVLVQGYTPFDERVILTATQFTGEPPYGEGLAIPIPTIRTLALEPPASIVTFSLRIGTTRRRSRYTGAIVVPSHCPPGGFPFAAHFTYADGSAGRALATEGCPS